jgi:pimeloyl-ACP methyl ester carboxylesterase
MSYAAEHPDDARERVSAMALVATATHVPVAPGLSGAAGRVICSRAGEWIMSRPRIGVLAARQAVGRNPRHSHLDLIRGLFTATSPAVRLDCLRALGRADLRAGLAKVNVPTVVLAGGWDMWTPRGGACRMANSIPNARLEVVPNAGHMLPLEAPEAVAAAIVDGTSEGLTRVHG